MQLLSTKKNKLLLLLPTCLVYVVYIILPILVSLYYSFTKYSGTSKPRLYGLKNYIRLLDDPYFWIALKNTAIILGISILLLGIGAFFVAMLLNQPMRGVNVCKALIFGAGHHRKHHCGRYLGIPARPGDGPCQQCPAGHRP